MYFYHVLRINKITFIFYITAWSIIGITVQLIFTLLHILTKGLFFSSLFFPFSYCTPMKIKTEKGYE